MNKQYIEIPKFCPKCNHPLSIIISESGTENLVCSNPNCGGKLIQQLTHFCGKSALDIKGISEKTLQFLVDKGWLKNIKGLYSLSDFRDKWIKCQGFGEKSVNKILQSIEASKNVSLDKFIVGLNIPEIGKKASKDLAKKFINWDRFRKTTYDDLISIDGFGDVSAQNILTFDYAEMDEIAKLMKNINTDNSAIGKVEANEAPLKDLSFVITGKLSRARALIQEDIEDAGGKVVGSISSKTNYLVINDLTSTSSKATKAKQLGISMISEEKLYEMMHLDKND